MNGVDLMAHRTATERARQERADNPAPVFDLNSQPEPTMIDQHDDEIAGTVSAYNERVKAIRADATLSEVGKAEALRDAYDTTSGRVAAMRGASQETVEARTSSLSRLVFGVGDAAALDYRNAQDRVSGLRDPHKLANLMDQAEATGDTTLLKAGFAHAWQQSRNPMAADMWGGIVDEYVRLNPGVAASLSELERLTTSRGRTAEMTRTMKMSVVKPKEVR